MSCRGGVGGGRGQPRPSQGPSPGRGGGRGQPFVNQQTQPPVRNPPPTAVASSSTAPFPSPSVERKVSLTYRPPPAQTAPAVQTPPAAISTQVAPASSTAVRPPVRPGRGTLGRKCVVRANRFLVEIADKGIHHYDDHVEGYHQLSAKTKTFFSTAVNLWDADFYIKVDDDVHVNLGTLAATLARHRTKPRVYMGCMKSGPVLSQKNVKYHEPEYWKFGEEDCEWKAQAGSVCVASFDWSCSGICKSVERIKDVHTKCGEDAATIWSATAALI